MEQKNPLVKKILKIAGEIFSGFMVFIPVLLVVQNYSPVQDFIVNSRKQEFFHMGEQLTNMFYVIYALSLPYLCWVAGKSVWGTKNIALGFLKAFLIHIGGVLFVMLALIFGPHTA